MSRPTSLHIMSQHWSITWHDDPKELLVFGEEVENKVGEQAMGYTNAGMQEINLRGEPACSFHAERDTLLHEALHALFNLTGLDEKLSDEDAEDIILRLSPAILTLMRENPQFVSYLTAKEPFHV